MLIISNYLLLGLGRIHRHKVEIYFLLYGVLFQEGAARVLGHSKKNGAMRDPIPISLLLLKMLSKM